MGRGNRGLVACLLLLACLGAGLVPRAGALPFDYSDVGTSEIEVRADENYESTLRVERDGFFATRCECTLGMVFGYFIIDEDVYETIDTLTIERLMGMLNDKARGIVGGAGFHRLNLSYPIKQGLYRVVILTEESFICLQYGAIVVARVPSSFQLAFDFLKEQEASIEYAKVDATKFRGFAPTRIQMEANDTFNYELRNEFGAVLQRGSSTRSCDARLIQGYSYTLVAAFRNTFSFFGGKKYTWIHVTFSYAVDTSWVGWVVAPPLVAIPIVLGLAYIHKRKTGRWPDVRVMLRDVRAKRAAKTESKAKTKDAADQRGDEAAPVEEPDDPDPFAFEYG